MPPNQPTDFLYLRETLFEDGVPLLLPLEVGAPPPPGVVRERVRRGEKPEAEVDCEGKDRSADEEKHPAAAPAQFFEVIFSLPMQCKYNAPKMSFSNVAR